GLSARRGHAAGLPGGGAGCSQRPGRGRPAAPGGQSAARGLEELTDRCRTGPERVKPTAHAGGSMQVNRDQLVEDSVFILQCLRQNARGGRQNGLDEVRSTLEGSVALDLAAYVGFLERFGYVEVESEAIRVTPQGERAAKGDADVSRDVQDHFRQVIESGAEPETFETLLKGIDDTQP